MSVVAVHGLSDTSDGQWIPEELNRRGGDFSTTSARKTLWCGSRYSAMMSSVSLLSQACAKLAGGLLKALEDIRRGEKKVRHSLRV